MSLNAGERRRTSQELAANLEHTGLTIAQVAADLTLTPERVRAAIDVDQADPVDTWVVRDYLHFACLDRGVTPVPYSVLTDSARRKGALWFALRDAPRHDFSTH